MNNDNKKNKNPQHQSDETDEKSGHFVIRGDLETAVYFSAAPPKKEGLILVLSILSSMFRYMYWQEE